MKIEKNPEKSQIIESNYNKSCKDPKNRIEFEKNKKSCKDLSLGSILAVGLWPVMKIRIRIDDMIEIQNSIPSQFNRNQFEAELKNDLQELFHDDEVHLADAGVVLHVGFGILALDHQIPAPK